MQERAYRYGVWQDTLEYVTAFNADPNTTYFLGMTPFADQTPQEYREASLCTNITSTLPTNAITNIQRNGSASTLADSKREVQIPSSLDWRRAGVVGPVRDQGQCGSCWAIGAVASTESAYALLPPQSGPPNLSEQELVDCTPGSADGNGCNGNSLNNAFELIINRGLGLESNYPYFSGSTGSSGTCRPSAAQQNQPYVTIDGYAYGEDLDDDTILEWAAFQPVNVIIDASSQSFQNYRSGIYDGPCGTDLNHAVTIVGYGSENGVPYWLVRNSYGPNWGEQGYIKMARGIGGQGICGINTVLTFPLYCDWNAECVRSAMQMKRNVPVRAVFPPVAEVRAVAAAPLEEEPEQLLQDNAPMVEESRIESEDILEVQKDSNIELKSVRGLLSSAA